MTASLRSWINGSFAEMPLDAAHFGCRLASPMQTMPGKIGENAEKLTSIFENSQP